MAWSILLSFYIGSSQNTKYDCLLSFLGFLYGTCELSGIRALRILINVDNKTQIPTKENSLVRAELQLKPKKMYIRTRNAIHTHPTFPPLSRLLVVSP